MKYYFSSPSSVKKILKECEVKNYLLSFAVDAKEVKHFQDTKEPIIIDSGAFSIWNKGGTVDIEKYIEFGKTLPDNYVFVNLDVIPKTGSSKADIEKCCAEGFENYLYLKQHLKNVLPVYHYGDNVSWLKKFMDHTDYIGISPANDTHENIKRDFLKEVFSLTRTDFKTHGLGYSSFEGLFMFPFYSVDSISYKRVIVNYKDEKINVRSCSAINFLIRNRIKEFLELETNVTEVWEKRGVIWE